MAASGREQHRAVARVEAFSDGVFGFAITLLVRAIRFHYPTIRMRQRVFDCSCFEQWPSYVDFALTFTVVGTVWANYRLAFSPEPDEFRPDV